MNKAYQAAFIDYLNAQLPQDAPHSLYRPAHYILQLGGKRIRPMLALLSADAVGSDFRAALPVALAVEVFHNFSLVHDDIMDEAPLRRGKPTLHEKWGLHSGILTGDVMLVMAYQCLDKYPPLLFATLTQLFSKTAREVCEGQQYDMDFPSQQTVTQEEYLEMIRLKTAVLLGCSLQMGAMVGGLSQEESQAFYDFGVHLGIAFQLQDDYLDAFGDPNTFGKQVGGDIIENKKTLLYILALKQGDASENAQLRTLFTSQPEDPTDKINTVKAIFQRTQADKEIQRLIALYTQITLSAVDQFKVTEEKKAGFKLFARELMHRKL